MNWQPITAALALCLLTGMAGAQTVKPSDKQHPIDVPTLREEEKVDDKIPQWIQRTSLAVARAIDASCTPKLVAAIGKILIEGYAPEAEKLKELREAARHMFTQKVMPNTEPWDRLRKALEAFNER